jgi:hypothetical protein
MKIFRIIALLSIVLSLTCCDSAYHEINPVSLNYRSGNSADSVALQYKYDVLSGKYARNESRQGIKIVALKITNKTDRDLVFGRDLVLVYENGFPVNVSRAGDGFKILKQHPATYLWYLLLTPLNIYTTEYDSRGFEEYTNSFPIGLIAGPALSIGNMVAAGTANRKFKSELGRNELMGATIEKGETTTGLITINNPSYDALELQLAF